MTTHATNPLDLSSAPASYTALRRLLHETATLGSVSALVSWDQETYMPEAAAEHRAEQSAMLAGIIHDRNTAPELIDALEACEADASLTEPGTETAAELREIRRDVDHATKLPRELVAALARTGSRAQEVWKKARTASDFAMFAPELQNMLDLSRRKAECLGIPEGGELYDALLDEYEPAARSAEIEAIFTPLGERQSALVGELLENGTPPDRSPIDREIPEDRQHAFGLAVLKFMGFDLHAGRLDTTTHPFCSGFAPGDTRLTTRYRGERFTDALFGTMHEGGHGLYEQGLPKAELFGSPLAGSVSLGIHESQSRMWENFVGRGRAFWTWASSVMHVYFGDAITGVTTDAMYAAANSVERSLIRVEADEATYNLHVMLRFEIERALIRGDLSVRDLPGAWNERFEQLLGVPVPDDRRGCLQDVHWSFGLLGYFPTYALGNLYAAQLWETINDAIPGLDEQLARGESGALLTWLREHIHRHGRRYTAGELCERATGKPLSPEPFLRHLEGKLKPVYGL